MAKNIIMTFNIPDEPIALIQTCEDDEIEDTIKKMIVDSRFIDLDKFYPNEEFIICEINIHTVTGCTLYDPMPLLLEMTKERRERENNLKKDLDILKEDIDRKTYERLKARFEPESKCKCNGNCTQSKGN